MACSICKGALWICELHPTQPCEHGGCRGVGIQCVCNPAAVMPLDFQAIAVSKEYEQMLVSSVRRNGADLTLH